MAIIAPRLGERDDAEAAGLAVFATAYLGLGVVTSSAWVWPLLALYGAFTALTDGVGKAWITDLLPAERHGSGLGLHLSRKIVEHFGGRLWVESGRGRGACFTFTLPTRA